MNLKDKFEFLPAAVLGAFLLASCNTGSFKVPEIGTRFDDSKKNMVYDTSVNAYVIPLDKNILSELERSEIQNNVEEDALDLLMLDVDDEDMDIDKESINALSSPEGSAPGVLLSYNGKYYGDPFKGRISVTVLRNYEILLKYEATNDKALLEMTDIATSFNVE